MKKEKKDKHFISKPHYEGGSKAMKSFLASQLRYPDEARKNKVEGTVHIKYEIGKDGSVIDTRVTTGIGHGCDEEAERIVKLLKFKMPNKSQKVKFYKTVQIHFRLTKVEKKVVPQQHGLAYTLVKKKEEKKPKPKAYTYTVNL